MIFENISRFGVPSCESWTASRKNRSTINAQNAHLLPERTKQKGRIPKGTVVNFQAFLISCLARALGTRKCLYCLGRFLFKHGSILPGRRYHCRSKSYNAESISFFQRRFIMPKFFFKPLISIQKVLGCHPTSERCLISRLTQLVTLTSYVVVAQSLFPPTIHAQSSDKPNVIFILMDDMGYSDISCYGAKTVSTPNIDRLAREGLKFTNFHSAASICSPSRAAFLTGSVPATLRPLHGNQSQSRSSLVSWSESW